MKPIGNSGYAAMFHQKKPQEYCFCASPNPPPPPTTSTLIPGGKSKVSVSTSRHVSNSRIGSSEIVSKLSIYYQYTDFSHISINLEEEGARNSQSAQMHGPSSKFEI